MPKYRVLFDGKVLTEVIALGEKDLMKYLKMHLEIEELKSVKIRGLKMPKPKTPQEEMLNGRKEKF